VVVAVAPLGERVTSTAKAPLLVPPDYRGLRLRAPTIPLFMQTLATLGARPEASPLADAQAAFAAGTLDGQEGPASTLAATRIGASGQRFVTRTGAFHDAMVFAMRGAVWAQWNEEIRGMLRETALDAARDAAPLTREDNALAKLGKQGVAVVRPTPAQRDALRAAVEPVWREWTAPIGAELVAAAVR
jgi:TRAP-type C4-dicarboxylate transport system substrate-binding protein